MESQIPTADLPPNYTSVSHVGQNTGNGTGDNVFEFYRELFVKRVFLALHVGE